jgi:hypothetical protein
MNLVAIDAKLWSYLPFLLLTVTIAIGVPVAYRLWRETHEEDALPRGGELLSDFEQAYAAGQMDEAEFRRIRDLLIGSKVEGGGGKIRTKPSGAADKPGFVPPTAPELPTTAPGDDAPQSPEAL